MQPEISEFSYGFALTNELIGWVGVTAAPIFPSLVEESKAGGGYDVKLDRPGAPLFLQFKRSERMERRSAQEYQSVRRSGGRLKCPFYRFPITPASKSEQHELLLALDTSPNLVFYVAPRFHKTAEINAAWHLSEVASRSVFISPGTIGSLDNNPHRIAFDDTSIWLCSEPRRVSGLTSRGVLEKIQYRLQSDPRPLRETLPELVEGLQTARQRARERIEEKREAALKGERDSGFALVVAASQQTGGIYPPEPSPIALRTSRELTPEQSVLREAADIAVRDFEAQLVIVQPAT